MDALSVRNIVSNTVFEMHGPVRIMRRIDDDKGDIVLVKEWDSEKSGTLPKEYLLNHEVVGLAVENGYLVIEIDGADPVGCKLDEFVINTIDDLCFFLNTTPKDIQRYVDEITDHTQWIECHENSVMLTATSEATGRMFSFTMRYPFLASEYNENVSILEELCKNDDDGDGEE